MMAAELLARLRVCNPDAEVVTRDLAACPPAIVDAAFSTAILAPPGNVVPALAQSEELIGELEACDALVIATPMHNYSVPAVLKAWIDQIVRVHRSSATTPAGKVGKLADRPAYIVVVSGGWFSGPSPTGTPPQPDFLTPYLCAIFATIGLRTVDVLTLEGVTRGPEALAHAFATARSTLDRLLPDAASCSPAPAHAWPKAAGSEGTPASAKA
jgi:FMN-dependent NADH-azoreductase